jgi:small conductance mechanosensitive channel
VAEVAAVVAVTFALYLLLRWLALRADAGFDSRAAGATPARRVALLLAAMLADALAVIVAGSAGYAFALGFGANDAGVVGFNTVGRIGFNQSLFLNAFLAVELIKVALRAVLVPLRTRLRLLPLGDAGAAYWYFWSSRLASLVGYGFLFVAPLLFDSGSWAAAQAVRMAVMLVAAVVVVALVLKNRAPVRARLRRRLASGHTDLPARLAALLGLVWHYLAIAYVLALLVVWLANPYRGLGYMLRASLDSLVTIALVRRSAGCCRGSSRAACLCRSRSPSGCRCSNRASTPSCRRCSG